MQIRGRRVEEQLIVSDPFTWRDAAELAEGIPFASLRAGAFVYDAGIFVPTAFDGTSPKADIGLFLGAETEGLIAATIGSSGRDLSAVDTPVGGLTGYLACGSAGIVQATAGSDGYAPLRITNAGPLYVVASQDGTKGGTPLDSTTGELIAWVKFAPNARIAV